MTVSAVPFALQNVPINADVVRQAVSSLIPNGGGLVQSGDLAVTQLSTAAMAVQVGVGRCWIDGTNLAHLSGQGYGKQGMYFIMNDAAYTVTIATSDATNPRIDVIYAATPDTAYAGASNTPVIAVATGTAISGAAYPANAPSLPNNSIALAWIMVGNGVTTILTANITQLATVGFRRKYVELVSTAPFTINGGSVSWDIGPLSIDTTRQWNNTFANTSGALSGAFNITESGVYAITHYTLGSGSPGNGWISMHLGAFEIIVTGNTGGYAWEVATSAMVYIPAGSYVRFVAEFTNTVGSCNSRVRITKISD